LFQIFSILRFPHNQLHTQQISGQQYKAQRCTIN